MMGGPEGLSDHGGNGGRERSVHLGDSAPTGDMNSDRAIRVAPTNHLRRLAQRILEEGRRSALGHAQRDEILEGVDREIALLVTQIDRLKEDRYGTEARFTYHECALGSELLQMEESNGRWWYGPNRMERWRDQQRLRGERVSMESQHVRLRSQFEQQARDLEARLLTLLNRRMVLSEVRVDDLEGEQRGEETNPPALLRLARRIP